MAYAIYQCPWKSLASSCQEDFCPEVRWWYQLTCWLQNETKTKRHRRCMVPTDSLIIEHNIDGGINWHVGVYRSEKPGEKWNYRKCKAIASKVTASWTLLGKLKHLKCGLLLDPPTAGLCRDLIWAEITGSFISWYENRKWVHLITLHSTSASLELGKMRCCQSDTQSQA